MAGELKDDDPIAPQGVTLRAFDDPKAARAGIYSGTLDALKKRFPLESKSHRLELSNIRYTGPQEFTLDQQKHALLSDKPLHTPVTGHFRLIDKASGAVVDERDEVVMDVPYYTDRGTIINNGSEYTVANQLRLRPGVYTRVRRSGDVETQFNVKPGTGRGFRLRMEPSTGVVTVNVGHANMPLYPLLKTLGVTDQQMVKAWGADVAHANAAKAGTAAGRAAIDKLYKAFAGYNATEQDLVSKERYIADTLPRFALDPGVTSRTLGIAAEGITPEVLLRAASKMFNVNRGEEKPDDRDNPGFANVYGIEDLYRERIEKDAGKLSRNIMWKLSRAGSLKPLGRGAFSGWHQELLQGSGLAMPGDNSNPMALEEQMMRVTRMGEGGIGSEDVVTDTARQINPGNLNFLDLLAGPENCMPGDAEVMTDAGWVRWDSVTPDTVFACMVDGRLEYHKAEALHVYDFDGTLYCGKSHALAYRYTPNHRMWCSPPGHRPRFRFELAKDVHGTKGRVIMTGGHQPFAGTYQEFFQLPQVVNPGNAYKPIPAIPMRDWAAFMGWYLTEGSTRYVPNKVFHVHIAQQKGGCLVALDKVIAAMPFKMYAVHKTVGGKRIQYGYSGSSRQLCEYLRTFGLAYDKYIPDYLLNADLETRKALFAAILLGDGRRKRDTFTFCSASRRFADTFVRLAFGLGYTTHLRFERDDRPVSSTGGMWCVHVLKGDHHQIVNDKYRTQMYTEHYVGKVYCATVPGGLMYCRYGDGLGYWTGNSKIGVDARLSVHARKGSDGKLYSLFLNRQGRKEYVASDKASDSVIGFPNPDPKADRIPAMKDGRVQMVPREEVDYFVPSMSGLFSSNVNLNPMPTSVQGGRQFYGAKFWGQYMPTVKGEAPLVDSLMPDGKTTWSEHYGRQLGTLRSPAEGTVTKVSDKGVTVTDEQGKKHFVETVTDFPFNGLTGLTYTPTVKVGDKVSEDDMLAASNFVDKKTGGLAMGVNLRMAWLPYKGYSVSGDTNVLWRRPDGSFTFGPIADVQVGQGMGSIAVDPKTGEQHIIDATAWMIHRPDAKMYCVRTSNGATVKVTGTHGMMKYDGHHGLVECRADELVPGRDVVAFVRPALPFGTGPATVTCERRNDKRRARTFALTRDFGWLVGIYLSEGCVVYRDGMPHHVCIACTEQGVIDNIQRICASLDISCRYIKTEYDRVESGRHVVSGKYLLNLVDLAYWFASTSGRYAWGKYIPDVTWTAPRDFALGLIDGYICGDGCITDKQSTISTSSPRMADGLCLLLNAIGVRANNRQYRYEGHALQRHAIHMVFMFRETVGNLPRITLGRKNSAVQALRELYSRSSKFKIGDVIPVPDGAPFAFGTGNPTVSRDKARTLLAKYATTTTCRGRRPSPRFLEDAAALMRMPLMWARVQAVDEIPSEPYVYDLDMRPYGTFVVGYGLVVHNSYEDAICISESAAKKLATDRLYGFEADPRDGAELGLNKYMSSFPKRFTKEQYATLDDNGVVKEGTVLNKGDPISVAVGPKLLTAEDANLGKLSKVLRGAFTDKAQVWDHDYPGTVVSSTVFRGRAKVNVKASPPMQMGDKLSPRFALKGVVGRIIPDDQMPRDAATNEPYDILMNPLGIPSRVAPGQLIETALGKLAKATGQQVRIPQDPPPEGWAKWASDQLAAAGVSPTADVFDPETGRTLHGIGDGYVYFHAMHHLADKKISAKGGSGGYTADLQPAKGGYGGAKRVSGLDTYALIAHGATEVMKDVQTVRGTKNEEYWKAVRSGGPLPMPQVPFVYQKAMNLLRAGGINVVEGQRSTDILPMTDKDTEELTGGRLIENSKMLDDDLKELKGGLFDPRMTGGNGNRSRWAAIALPEPIPNPVMEEPVRRILGLTSKKLQAVISGEEKLNGLTGGEALKAALGSIDVDREIARQRDIVRKSRGSVRDNAVKVIGYLSGCKKQGVTPKDWMISKVPVIPPMFRPIAKVGDTALVSDINELYRDVIESADAFRQLREDVPDSGLAEERLNVYNAVKAAYGLGEAISPEGQAKRLKGAIRQVIGTSPKLGLWQSKVISKAVDGVGRAVISPEPNYDMDQCGIPEDEAWTLYKDYVVRNLRHRGYPEERAMQLIEERAPVARDMLLEEMGRRPVILDRAPTWHKFNLMAFWPSLVEGDTMRMNPVVEKAFTADHDGDEIIGKIVISCNLSGLRPVTVVGGRKISIEKLLHGAVKNDILPRMNIKKDIPLLKAAVEGESLVVVDFEDIPVGRLERTTQGQNGPIEWYKPAVPFSVAAYDEQTGAPVWAPVRWVTKHPQRVIEVVTLNYGNQIITDDDPRAVYGMDPASPDMAMARFTPSDALARHVVVPVARGTMQQLCSSVGAMSDDGVLPLNRDTGYLLGAMAGDGWWDKRDYGSRIRRVHLADLHGDVARRVEHVLHTLYGEVSVSRHEFHKEDSPGRYGDTVRYTYAFSEVRAVTEHLTQILGGEGDDSTAGSANKHLPVYMLNTSAEFRRGMLCGLMDTDGTVALTKGGFRARPQLALQFVSTSLRLCRDVALLAESLGVRTSVSFSKETVRGNPSWMAVLSAKDAKAANVLDGLADAGKRSRFMQAEVDGDHVNSAFDAVVLPLVVRDELLRWLPAMTKEERADYQRVWQAKESGVIARYIVPRIVARLERLWADRRMAAAEASALLADKAARRDYSVTPEEVATVRRGITMLAHKSGDRALYDAGQKAYKNTVRPLKTGRMPESTLALLYRFLKDTEVGPCVTESPLVRTWRDRFVANESVGWDRVVSVEKTGKREDGYDLNVPGYETYMSVDGTILSNTMNFHVPSSDKAVEEAIEKMLPSKNLFSTTDLKSPRYVPMMEMTLGLARLTAPASTAKPRVFVTARDAIRAYRRGEIGANDPVSVLRP